MSECYGKNVQNRVKASYRRRTIVQYSAKKNPETNTHKKQQQQQQQQQQKFACWISNYSLLKVTSVSAKTRMLLANSIYSPQSMTVLKYQRNCKKIP